MYVRGVQSILEVLSVGPFMDHLIEIRLWKESWKEPQKKIGIYPFFVKIWEIDLPLSR
jgi:hypothetical protein